MFNDHSYHFDYPDFLCSILDIGILDKIVQKPTQLLLQLKPTRVLNRIIFSLNCRSLYNINYNYYIKVNYSTVSSYHRQDYAIIIMDPGVPLGLSIWDPRLRYRVPSKTFTAIRPLGPLYYAVLSNHFSARQKPDNYPTEYFKFSNGNYISQITSRRHPINL